jgi:DNA-binding NtrC family response regulator
LLAQRASGPVLLEGESGTGKTGLAWLIHDASARASGPFEKVDLGGIDREFGISELFGHLKDSFTGARTKREGAFVLAHRGTIALDEIGKCGPAVQAMLLNAIEYGEVKPLGAERSVVVDVRVIATTNISLRTLCEQGRFLPDLRARLASLALGVPALRDRRADLPFLIRAALERAVGGAGLSRTPEVSAELNAAFVRYTWPDNVRELFATVARIVIESDGAARLTLRHVAPETDFGRTIGRRRKPRVRTENVIRAWLDAGQRPGKAADALGCHRTTVHRHLANAGLA